MKLVSVRVGQAMARSVRLCLDRNGVARLVGDGYTDGHTVWFAIFETDWTPEAIQDAVWSEFPGIWCEVKAR